MTPPQATPKEKAEALPHEVRGAPRYDLKRAIRAVVKRGFGSGVDGLEGETSAEIARRTGRQPKGFYLPHNAEVRSLNLTTGAGALETEYSTVIDALRAKCLVARLGATILPDLHGRYAMPVKTGTVTLGWFPDGGAPAAESNPVIGHDEFLTPHTTGAYTDMSRIAIETEVGGEDVAVDELLAAIAVEIDRAALSGGTNPYEPTGLLNRTDVPVLSLGANGAALTYPNLVAGEQALGNANADSGPVAFVTTPNGRAKLRLTSKTANSYVWDDNSVLGSPAYATTNVPSNGTKGTGTGLSAAVLGNWADLVIGLYGPIDVLINPYTLSTAGFVRISALQDADVALKHAASFLVWNDFATT